MTFLKISQTVGTLPLLSADKTQDILLDAITSPTKLKQLHSCIWTINSFCFTSLAPS